MTITQLYTVQLPSNSGINVSSWVADRYQVCPRSHRLRRLRSSIRPQGHATTADALAEGVTPCEDLTQESGATITPRTRRTVEPVTMGHIRGPWLPRSA